MAFQAPLLSFTAGSAALLCAGFVSVLAHALVLMLAPGRAALVLPDALAHPDGALQWRMQADATPAPSLPATTLKGAARPLPASPLPTRIERGAALASPKRPAAPGASQQSSVPRPLQNPQFDAIRLAGFRLPLQLWVGPDGHVQALAWGATEVAPALLDALGAALRQVGFMPALQDGRPVTAELRLNLCFDDEGALRAPAPECWDPDAVR